MKMKSTGVARYAAVVAIVAVGIAIDSMLTAQFGLSAAIATLLVVLPLTQAFTIRESVVACATFGVLSLIRAYVLPSVTSVAFMKIEVAILPRLAIAFTAHFVYRWLARAFKGARNAYVKKYLASALSAAVGMLTNTILVLTAITLGSAGNVLDKVISTFVAGYSSIELVLSVVLVPVVTARLVRIFRTSADEEVNA